MSFGMLKSGVDSLFGRNAVNNLASFGNNVKRGVSSAINVASDVAKEVGDIGQVAAPAISTFNPMAGNFVGAVSAGLKAGSPIGHAVADRINSLPISSLLKK